MKSTGKCNGHIVMNIEIDKLNIHDFNFVYATFTMLYVYCMGSSIIFVF